MLNCTFFSRESLTHFPFCVFCGCLGGQGIWCSCSGSVWALRWKLNPLFHYKINEISLWNHTCFYCDGYNTPCPSTCCFTLASLLKMSIKLKPLDPSGMNEWMMCVCLSPGGSDVPLDVSKGDKSQSDLVTPTSRWWDILKEKH